MNAEEFKKIRQALKLKGFEIAKRIGKSTQEAFEFETGKRSIPDDVAKYLRAIDPRQS
jgi:DNA-binding transcriptional regulator YiaG